MTPVFLNTASSSPFPALELKEDHQHFQLLFSTNPPSYQASSSHPCPSFFNSSTQSQRGDHSPRDPQQHEDKDDKYISHGGCGESQVFSSSSLLQPMADDNKSSHKLSVFKKEEGDEGNKSTEKWMSSKMRLMRKMMNSDCTTAKIEQKVEDHQQWDNINEFNSSNNTSNIPIRVCSDCNTTKTPLWRSGPRGPKSLCNACGIRQRKARRAMAAAAAAAANGTAVGTEISPMKMKLPNKEKKMHTSNVGQQKKLCKPPCPPPTEKKLCFEDFTSSICKNSGFRRVFPRDEEEAAILLMALSCDLVYS